MNAQYFDFVLCGFEYLPADLSGLQDFALDSQLIPIALPVLLSETQAVFCDDLVGAVWFFNAGFYINDYLMPTTIPCRNQMNNIIRVVKIAFLSLHHWILRVPFNSHR